MNAINVTPGVEPFPATLRCNKLSVDPKHHIGLFKLLEYDGNPQYSRRLAHCEACGSVVITEGSKKKEQLAML